MITQDELDKLEIERGKLRQQLSDITSEIDHSLMAAWIEFYGLKIGETVLIEDNHARKRYLLARLETPRVLPRKDIDNWNRPWVQGYAQRKDGAWGAQLRNLYGHWEVEK